MDSLIFDIEDRDLILDQSDGDIIADFGAVGLPGPPGIFGAPVHTAGEAIGGHRAVFVAADGLAYYADPATADVNQPIGVTLGAAVAGAALQVQGDGEIQEPSWAWVAGPVYLGGAGVLTQTPPAGGSIFMLGIAAGPTRLRVTPRLIVKL